MSQVWLSIVIPRPRSFPFFPPLLPLLFFLSFFLSFLLSFLVCFSYYLTKLLTTLHDHDALSNHTQLRNQFDSAYGGELACAGIPLGSIAELFNVRVYISTLSLFGPLFLLTCLEGERKIGTSPLCEDRYL